MQAIEISRPGGPEVLRLAARPLPRAGRGEVLVRVLAAGVNRPDVLQRKVPMRRRRELPTCRDSRWPA